MREFENGCPYCGGTRWHLDGCPNDRFAAESAGRLKCALCGEPIMDSEKVLEAEGGCICIDCLCDMTPAELLHLVGVELCRASEVIV